MWFCEPLVELPWNAPGVNQQWLANPRGAGGKYYPISYIGSNLKAAHDNGTELSVPYPTSILHLRKFCEFSSDFFFRKLRFSDVMSCNFHPKMAGT